MSKKNKNKFHKRVKQELLREMAKVEVKPQAENSESIFAASPEPNQTIAPQAEIPLKPLATEEAVKTPDALAYIKSDLKKSAIIIGSIIIVIVALTIWDTKTNVLTHAGSQVFKVLHIGNQ